MDTAPTPISVQQLRNLIGTAAAPLVIDASKAPAFDSDATMIAGSLRRAHDTLQNWAPSLRRERPVVTCCVRGHEVSQGAARALRELGFDATYLAGGVDEWKQAGAPTITKHRALGVPSAAGSRWVTRERPKIDRIACPWLVRRFIDPSAQFIFVPGDKVRALAIGTGAIPYAIPDVEFSHAGDECSFEVFIKRFGLNDPCLDDLAVIVRGADTGKPELTPRSPGLLAISLRLSVNYPDDHAMLEHGMVVYDALYAWIRCARAEVRNADLFKKKS